MLPESNATKISENGTSDLEAAKTNCDLDNDANKSKRLGSKSTVSGIQLDCGAVSPKRQNDKVQALSMAGNSMAKSSELRERRSRSPTVGMPDSFPDPMSPSSSSSASHSTSGIADATFEPTIEMMVNDFDDEQTLNEEEALAALESQDPQDEIATLKEEGEMPLEELLAKYRAISSISPPVEPVRKKVKKSSSGAKRRIKAKPENDLESADIIAEDRITKQLDDKDHYSMTTTTTPTSIDNQESTNTADVIIIESGDERDLREEEDKSEEDDEHISSIEVLSEHSTPVVPENEEYRDNRAVEYTEKVSMRCSHLLDLYPEGTFDKVASTVAGDNKAIPLEILYGVADDDDEEVEDEEDFKKTIMVGSAYQATIPVGLSQYGDVLPYENEDKLIWEPSQVSEREVEEYLLKARDIRPTLSEDEPLEMSSSVEAASSGESFSKENSVACSPDSTTATDNDKLSSSEYENGGVIKDNEQALHLLVQCGYDFKEALRRKRLNALPLTDSMSLWSEEECHKFEEGIQKYGKDFLKIRQNQVRTRTMRELVQFYYLWKKSERRDHNFANADTVDHMDIYLNEDGEYGNSNGASHNATATATAPSSSPPSAASGIRRNSNSAQNSFSIMTGSNTTGATVSSTTVTNSSADCMKSVTHTRRRVGTSNSLVASCIGGNECESGATTSTLNFAK